MNILICGSGFSIQQTDGWDLSTHIVVAVNNAHGRVKWNYFCCSEDYEHEYVEHIGFPQNLIAIDFTNKHSTGNFFNQQSTMYAIEQCGGWDKCGRSTVLAAAYCSLVYFGDTINQIGFIGSDMVYSGPDKTTAYYGKGIDIARKGMSDPSLMAKFQREYHGSVLNEYFNKPWANLTDQEIIHFYYNRLSLYAKQAYGVNLVNYSTMQDTLLPYERKTYI